MNRFIIISCIYYCDCYYNHNPLIHIKNLVVESFKIVMVILRQI